MNSPPLPPTASPANQWHREQRRNRFGLLGAILVIGIYVLLVANWLGPVGVRFAPGPANIAVLVIALLLPGAALTLIILLCRGATRAVGAILVALPALPSTFVACCLMLFGDPVGFERLHDVKARECEVVVYRTNGGATTSYGICVRQELPLRFGLRMVREIYRARNADDASVDVRESDTVKIVSNNYRNPQVKTIQLQPLVRY